VSLADARTAPFIIARTPAKFLGGILPEFYIYMGND